MSVRFPRDPDKIQNGSQPDFPWNMQDIVMQGYRRSLADWLAICNKSYAQWLEARAQGYGVKQALVLGLPYDPPKPTRGCLLFADTKDYLPKKLSELQLRSQRLYSYLAKTTEMPERFRRVWSNRLLTECYSCWRERRVWKPTVLDWYPHTAALATTAEEWMDVECWKHLVPGWLEGCWDSGFVPTERLMRYYGSTAPVKGRGLIDWYPLIAGCEFKADEIVPATKLCEAISTHKYVLYRAFASKGIKIEARKGYTFADWLELAKKADSVKTHRRQRLGAKTNFRR